ncbi:outer membrane beta-barrel protein [Dyadobacter sp. CY356]|uniref:outer membrane beta-barrel protein n=1 Tax=Dyadobacter sp. CY356 TaxID=2906442 RepID=UPI001F36604F|nr:outer membrane beta-barrel protein [Dyadobacter sp. CY356]MCF0059155.1 PorT family protein [Dyadobacter sp. CY356]
MKILFTYLFLIFPLILTAQHSQPHSLATDQKKHFINYIGFRFGGLASSFSHSSSLLIPSPGKKSMPAFHAGAAMDFFSKANYNARVELSYLSKGAKETFQNDRIAIQSTNRLHYVQLSALPLVIKTGDKKINPYIALGGYFARRIGIKSRSKTGQENWENDPMTANNLNVENDYGYSVSAGINIRKRPLFEIRYEAGLHSVSTSSDIKNRSLIVSFFI